MIPRTAATLNVLTRRCQNPRIDIYVDLLIDTQLPQSMFQGVVEIHSGLSKHLEQQEKDRIETSTWREVEIALCEAELLIRRGFQMKETARTWYRIGKDVYTVSPEAKIERICSMDLPEAIHG